MKGYRITVGGAGSDLAGWDGLAIQCALDRVAAAGGGEVILAAGRFRLEDALRLRSRVALRGQGDDTELVKNDMVEARVTRTIGCGFREIPVDHPERFRAGQGVTLRDDTTFGFLTTYATLLWREGAVWHLDSPLRHDIAPGGKNGRMQTFFPMICVHGVADVAVTDLRLDGNPAGNPWHPEDWHTGGVLAIGSERLQLLRLAIEGYNGEGISFQGCREVEIGHCRVTGCGGSGFHPGGGTTGFHVRHCEARGNGWWGFMYCLRTTGGVVEDSVFADNGWEGMMLGSQNSGNVNRRLVVRGNRRGGILFPERPRAESSHGVLFEDCEVADNGRGGGAAEIDLRGENEGTRFIGCRIHAADGNDALRIGPGVRGLVLENNAIRGAVADRRKPAG